MLGRYNGRRHPAPHHFVDALQSRLRQAAAIIRARLPKEASRPLTAAPVPLFAAEGGDPRERGLRDVDTDALPDSITVEMTGALDVDGRGRWDFHGYSSGCTSLRRMPWQCGHLFGSDIKVDPLHRASACLETDEPLGRSAARAGWKDRGKGR
ncbi:MAG: hypothetical protein M1826_002980 [Phylliscum demangeonii]|nr:MAG: hypothetical protein M1826_002980 [Phylliscum demangeonii]